METKSIEVTHYEKKEEHLFIEFEQNIGEKSDSRTADIHLDEVDNWLQTKESSQYDQENRLRELWDYKDNPTFRTLKDGVEGLLEELLKVYFNINVIEKLEVQHAKVAALKKDIGKITESYEKYIGQVKLNLELVHSLNITDAKSCFEIIKEIKERYNSNTPKIEAQISKAS